MDNFCQKELNEYIITEYKNRHIKSITAILNNSDLLINIDRRYFLRYTSKKIINSFLVKK